MFLIVNYTQLPLRFNVDRDISAVFKVGQKPHHPLNFAGAQVGEGWHLGIPAG